MTQSSDAIAEFVNHLGAELGKSRAPVPIERRRLSTVATKCGTRASERFLTALARQLAAAEIHTAPSLDSPGLRRDDWLRFSTKPFPADELLFPRERDLQKFVEACMGMGPFRDLRVFQDGRRAVGREYHLPDGQRVDLLCEERTKRGLGRLVAIELKRENEQGTVEQVIRYIKALRTLFAPRKVRGLIITAHEDLDAASSLKGALLDGYEIEWHCYRVDFKEAGHGD